MSILQSNDCILRNIGDDYDISVFIDVPTQFVAYEDGGSESDFCQKMAREIMRTFETLAVEMLNREHLDILKRYAKEPELCDIDVQTANDGYSIRVFITRNSFSHGGNLIKVTLRPI